MMAQLRFLSILNQRLQLFWDGAVLILVATKQKTKNNTQKKT